MVPGNSRKMKQAASRALHTKIVTLRKWNFEQVRPHTFLRVIRRVARIRPAFIAVKHPPNTNIALYKYFSLYSKRHTVNISVICNWRVWQNLPVNPAVHWQSNRHHNGASLKCRLIHLRPKPELYILGPRRIENNIQVLRTPRLRTCFAQFARVLLRTLTVKVVESWYTSSAVTTGTSLEWTGFSVVLCHVAMIHGTGYEFRHPDSV